MYSEFICRTDAASIFVHCKTIDDDLINMNNFAVHTERLTSWKVLDGIE